MEINTRRRVLVSMRANGVFSDRRGLLIIACLSVATPTCAFSQHNCPQIPPSSATLQVDSTTDGLNAGACLNKLTGQCTLREAIQEANSQAGAMIDIPAGTYTLTIPPAGGDDNTTGDLNVTAAMTLVGTGTTIITAGASQTAGIDRVFHITGNGTVSVSNVVIEFGQTNNSSDLANQGGGGILFDGSEALCLKNVGILNNTATNKTYGGGLAVIGTGPVYLDGATITDNVAGDAGGGIEAVQSGALNILNSIIQQNTASGRGTGGGLDVNSGSAVAPVEIYLSGTQVVNNTADGLTGGGLSVWGNNLVINQSTIGSNTLSAGGSGGGIFVGGAGNVDITDTNVSGNINGAPGSNTTNEGGGMGLFTTGTVQISGSTVSNNKAVAGSPGPKAEADGGGIYAFGPNGLSIMNSTIVNNSASAEYGTSVGGGFAGYGVSVAIVGSTINGNTASLAGGGASIDGRSGASFIVVNTKITNNTATGNAANTNFQCGGGVLVSGIETGQLSLSTVSGNSGPYGGGVCVLSPAGVTFLDDSISNNRVSGVGAAGGGIYATSPITVTGSTANGNSADQGAGIFLEGAAAITNVTITGNQPGAGLEVVSTGGSTTVSFATISGNAVGIQTAGPRGALSLQGTIVANNSSDCRTPDQLMFLAFNLFGSQTCGVSTYGQYPPGSGQYSYGGPGNVFNVKPMLGPLQDNGGPTQTMAPLPGSPAIDAVGATVCPPPATDQRGITRPQGKSCDIGAVEVKS